MRVCVCVSGAYQYGGLYILCETEWLFSRVWGMCICVFPCGCSTVWSVRVCPRVPACLICSCVGLNECVAVCGRVCICARTAVEVSEYPFLESKGCVYLCV